MGGIDEIKLGDTVRLKSGGPLMTVNWMGGKVTCVWFIDDKFNSATLHREALRKDEKPERA